MQEIEHRPTARVLNILELLASSQEGLTLTEISEAIDAPKSTIFPILKTMTQRKFIFVDSHVSRYKLGISSYIVGSAYSTNVSALEFILSEMRYVVSKCKESCQLGILDRDMILYTSKVESDEPIRLVSYVGKRLPAYCTAIGKSLLSGKTIAELKELYPDGLKAYTENTITSFERLEEQLTEIQRTQIATECAEVTDHIHCISTPLKKHETIIASMSVSFPDFRTSDEHIAEIKHLLLESKDKIEMFFRDHDVDVNHLTY